MDTQKKKKLDKKQYANNKKYLEIEELKNLKNLKKKLRELDPAAIDSFTSFPLSNYTLKGLKENGFTEPTKVQCQTLIHSLQGLDVVAAAKTGSGKTLAFLIPLLELLYERKWNKYDGLGAVIITPTRELAYQIFEVFNKMGKHHSFSLGLVIGGKDLKFEWSRIGVCNILICTPGRLLQHMTENPEFTCEHLQLLVLDEADQCLSMGFSDTMNTILEELPSERQTLLFSATQTRDVNNLIRAGCKDPIFCSVHEFSKTVTPKTLRENYMICEESEKIKFLWSFLKHHRRHKILVFLATCKQVKFVFNLFTHLRPGLTVMSLHGHMHQLKRMAIYDEFCKKKKAVLFATDVAARGLDIPSVDWVIQLDCPEDVTTYIHRVGRTARHTSTGEALLLLTPSQENEMLNGLKAKNIPIEKIDVDPNKLMSIQLKIEFVLSKYYELKEEAERAFKAYIKSLCLMKNADLFNVAAIDMDSFARSLGLTVTPRVRFLTRQLKKKSVPIPSNKSSEETMAPVKTSSLGITPDDDSEDEFLHRSKSQPVDENSEDILKDYTLFTNSSMQTITKFDIAKKVMKNKLKLNKKIVFDSDGEEESNSVSNLSKQSQELLSSDGKRSGIDISERQEFLKSQDKIDKEINSQRLKEKHRKEKAKLKALKQANREAELENDEILEDEEMDEGDSEEDTVTQQIIDELPDPDVIYNKGYNASDKDSDNNNNNDDEEEEDDDIDDSRDKTYDIISSDKSENRVQSQKKISGKRKAIEKVKEAKRAKIAAENDFESISCSEKEAFALYLLQGS